MSHQTRGYSFTLRSKIEDTLVGDVVLALRAAPEHGLSC